MYYCQQKQKNRKNGVGLGTRLQDACSAATIDVTSLPVCRCASNRADRVYCVRVWPYPRCGSDRLPYIQHNWASVSEPVVSRAALYGAVLRICMSICLPYRKSSTCNITYETLHSFPDVVHTVNRRARESAGTETMATTKAQIDRDLPTSVPPQWRQQRRTPLVDLPIH